MALLAASPATAAHWNVDAARIAFDPNDLAHSSADVTIDVMSESSGDDETDDGVKGAQGFQASEFATARFQTTGIAHKGGNDYIATARLTIRGVTRTVALPFTLTIAGNSAHMVGTTEVSRMDFAIGQGGDFAKPAPVAYQVTVKIDLTATKGT